MKIILQTFVASLVPKAHHFWRAPSRSRAKTILSMRIAILSIVGLGELWEGARTADTMKTKALAPDLFRY